MKKIIFLDDFDLKFYADPDSSSQKRMDPDPQHSWNSHLSFELSKFTDSGFGALEAGVTGHNIIAGGNIPSIFMYPVILNHAVKMVRANHR